MRYLGVWLAVFLGLVSFPISAAQITTSDVPESALVPYVVHSAPEAAGEAAQLARRADRLIERASAVNGTQYAVVAPIFTSGNVSYLRLFNGQGLPGFTSKSTTFAVGVVGSPSGTLYGTAQIAVPALASKQVAISEILSLASVAGLSGSDTGYSLFIQNACYFDDEYRNKITWGHSCVSEVVRIAHLAQVGELQLFHHDPDQDDAKIELKGRIASDLLSFMKSTTRCTVPKEGDVLVI